MKHFKTVLVFFACISAACGGQVVEFGPDASNDATPDVTSHPDAGPDATVDASPEASVDAGLDAKPDAKLDASDDASDASLLAPLVTLTTPAPNALHVSVNEHPTAKFNMAMDGTTVTGANFTLKQGINPVPITLSLDIPTNTVTFIPTTPLTVGLVYTALITTGAKSFGGTPMAAPYTWSFTTDACSMAGVPLGGAGAFVALAGSTVTSVGPTSITGDLGVSPGSAVTGFPPGIVIGTQHVNDPTAATGIADLTTAYNDAKGRSLCAVTVAGNLGGQTLTPGLYTSTSSLSISSGDLTLDAQGDSAGVFIFQMASTLTTTAARKVILTNGAKSANVFWQVGTSATLGSTTDFQGTIMADQAITLNTGATLNGRALARIAGVSLDSNVMVMPAP